MNNVSKDPRSEIIRRHHIHEKTLGRNIKNAVKKSKYTLPIKTPA
jgi:hypothetical protein